MAGRDVIAGDEGSFDALAVSAQRGQLVGTLNARTLPRVAERLAGGGDVPLSWRVTGATDALGRPALTVELSASVSLECQCCLRVFCWPVEQRTLLLLACDEQDMARLDEVDEHEVLLAAAPLEVRTLIEDELLLTLPFVPRCREGQCAGAPVDGTSPVGRRPTAFAALAGLQAPTEKKQKR